MRKRNVAILFRLNKKEAEVLDKKVKKSGLNREAYLRQLISGVVPRDAPPPDYYSMMRELHKIGNNLNQIAQKAHVLNVIDVQRYDQEVWKVSLPGLHSVFFLRFCPPAKRISYAASLGGDSIPPYNAKLCYRYLKEFKAISVREDSAVTLLEGLGPDIHPTHVLDPVLLVGKDFWKRYITPHTDPQYLLMYFLDSVSEHEDIILAAIAKYPTHKIRMITTGVQINSIENIEYIEPSPLEFVSLIHNAEFVLTDSFHGSAFSILFDKEFIVLPRNYKVFSGQSARIFSLLAMFECRDRYVTAAAQVSEIRSINGQKTEAILHKMQRTSTSFLAKAINE